ncbi:DivIVA domain-containing protein [Nesterenkonia sp. HG001]|uniref:DivIVA domain-containing protein n=1 Tax=Nesterenkonia sp. HG001 TaxID=2983207 RepID=UPI002AC749F0|nr:DivIVA domain-containing protein [Nesterenkonia sp. HG001]MDZ5076338.1 DivIVA domain-containing protein [Nesterenkonia sp. HG001]
MIWLYLLAVALLGVVVVLLVGRAEGAEPPAEETTADEVAELLADRAAAPLSAADLRGIRLQPALRGYRMEQVDRLLDALADQLETGRNPDQPSGRKGPGQG